MDTSELREIILNQVRDYKAFPIEIRVGTNVLTIDVKRVSVSEKRVFTGVEHMGVRESYLRQTLSVWGLEITCRKEPNDIPVSPPGWLDMRKLTVDDPDEYFPVKFRN